MHSFGALQLRLLLLAAQTPDWLPSLWLAVRQSCQIYNNATAARWNNLLCLAPEFKLPFLLTYLITNKTLSFVFLPAVRTLLSFYVGHEEIKYSKKKIIIHDVWRFQDACRPWPTWYMQWQQRLCKSLLFSTQKQFSGFCTWKQFCFRRSSNPRHPRIRQHRHHQGI